MDGEQWNLPLDMPGMGTVYTPDAVTNAKAVHHDPGTHSPKLWASVELPDMFLSNLFHGDYGLGDASHPEFAASVSGSSESDGSPKAFEDFMQGTSPDDTNTASPDGDAQHAPTPESVGIMRDEMLGATGGLLATQPFPGFAPLSDAPAVPNSVHDAAPAQATVSLESLFVPIMDMGKSQELVAQDVQPLPTIEMERQVSETPSSTSPGCSTDTGLPGMLHMAPGSNVNAHVALGCVRAFAEAQNSSSCASASQGTHSPTPSKSSTRPWRSNSASTSPSPQSGDANESWSKKVAHNVIERRYRSNINDRIAQLRHVVPALREMQPRTGQRRRRRGKAEQEQLVDGVAAATKMSKATVLTKATEYICHLKTREVELEREVSGMQMLLRSLDGGDDLLAAWSTEMERMHRLHPATYAAYGNQPPIASPSSVDDADDSDNEEQDLDTVPSKMPRYMFGAFVSFSFMGSTTDWGTETSTTAPFAPSHTRVLGASHQLLKRASSDSRWASHHYDHIPMLQLVIEILRNTALLFFFLCMAHALYGFLRRRRVQKGNRRAAQMQSQIDLHALMASPLERINAPTYASLDAARGAYHALQTILDVPPGALLVWTRILRAAAFSALQSVPFVSTAVLRYVHAHNDPAVLRMEKQAWLRRTEMELALDIQPSWSQRFLSLLALQSYLSLAPLCDADTLILAMAYSDLAKQTRWMQNSMLERAAHLWNTARARCVANKNENGMALIVAVPLDRACESMRSKATLRDAPLGNVLCALRHDDLLLFWATLLASMMRASTTWEAETNSLHARLRPAVLDVVRDKASLRRLSAQLANAANDLLPRTERDAEAVLVASGTLALVCGNVESARHCMQTLVRDAPSLSMTHQFIALVDGHDTTAPLRLTDSTDTLASVVLGWMRLQRAWCVSHHNESSSAYMRLSKDAQALQQLVSQSIWMGVGVTDKEQKLASAETRPSEKARKMTQAAWHQDNASEQVHKQALFSSLDVLMDHLVGITAHVQEHE
ncbi:hypothetical protein MVES_001717 [Malassezia vespertilionis]|uniref:BHLH domain-containing protein n=2 Tax=Malassezia vespertilionis TaxID=2020962 RepID=A0A2N1JD60_9BASI|nr:hypothetical protein MVES_001717 [Malassezia vespertilionis]